MIVVTSSNEAGPPGAVRLVLVSGRSSAGDYLTPGEARKLARALEVGATRLEDAGQGRNAWTLVRPRVELTLP